MLTFEQIKELIDIVCQKGLQGLEIERSDFRLRIEGQGSSGNTLAGSHTATAMVQSIGQPGGAAATEGHAPEGGREHGAHDGAHTITSPIVGTFYSSPSPDADPYVQVGDEVKTGQVLCIVEAMKLMNEIESDLDGTVVEVFGRNSQPVEFGEPLFAVKPA